MYWIQYYRGGKVFRESSKSTKEGKAKKLLKLREGQITEGRFPGLKVEKVKFEELCDDLINDYKVNGRKSLNRVQFALANLSKYFAGMKVSQLSTGQINTYVLKRQETVKNATINRELSALKRMLTLAVRSSPAKVVNPPHISLLQENNTRTGYFEYHEFMTLREVLPDYLKPVATMAYYTGMRKEEILSLLWEQVNLLERKITLTETKSKEPRIIYLTDELYQILLIQKQIRDAEYPDCPYVFFYQGHKIGDFHVTWRGVCTRVGLQGKLFHDLRRTAIRNMVRMGISERVAMMISGHRTRAIFDRYNIVNEADLERAAQIMNDAQENQKRATNTKQTHLGENGITSEKMNVREIKPVYMKNYDTLKRRH